MKDSNQSLQCNICHSVLSFVISILFFRLFRESEEDDALIIDELIQPTFTVFNSSAQKLRQSKFQASAGSRNNYSSSFSSNVPSPAPNGQVPSPGKVEN